jgi:site-specific DNA recombinase
MPGQANRNYLNEGIALLELANRAAKLFEKQPPREKRKLLDFLLSNCSWGDGVLTPKFRQSLDMIADASTQCAKDKAAGATPDDLRQLKGG